MSIAQQYLELRSALAEWGDNEPNKISLPELAEILVCSERNVKLILKKMSEEDWIEWQPGRGRGHLSSLTFTAPREQVLMEAAIRLAEKGEVQAALEQIRLHASGTSARERFVEWLSGYFGYQVEPKSASQQEILRFPIRKPIHRLDPAATFFETDANVIRQIFDTLVRFDHVKQEVTAHIAHYWESDEARQRWVFYLRKGVFFHHGRELTADDVVYSIERLLDLASGSAYKSMYDEVRSVTAKDAATVVFELSSPHYLFPQFLSSYAASILPRELVESKGEIFFRSPIGSGPFRVVANLPSKCVLEAFPSYFKGRAHLDQVEIITLPEDCLSLEEMPWNQIVVQPASNPVLPMNNWSSAESLFKGCSVITFNLHKTSGPQRHLAFRQALHHLTDRNRMIRELGETRQYCAYSFTPGPAYTTEDFNFNEKLGLKLLEEVQYAGEPFHLCTTAPHLEDVQWLQKQYEAYGINVRFSVHSIEGILDPATMAAADGYFFKMLLEDEVAALFEHFRSELSYIRAHLSDDMRVSSDRLLKSLLKEPDAQARLGLIRILEHMLGEDRSLLFLLHYKQVTTLHTAVKGFSYNLLGGVEFKEIWFHQNESGK